jgi:hypothetical protein
MTDDERALRAALHVITMAVYRKVADPVWTEIHDAWRLARDVRDAPDPAELFRFRTRNHPELLNGVPERLDVTRIR